MLDVSHAPALSAAWAPPPVAVLEARWHEAPAPRVAGADAAPGDVDLFRRRHQRGKAGVIVYAASAGAIAAGTVVFAVGAAVVLVDGAEAATGFAVGGAGLVFAGAVGSIVGQVLLFEGGIGAAKVAGIDRTVGWVGVGLVLGAIPTGWVLAAIDPDLAYAASAMSLGGLVCGAVQLAEAGSAGRDRQWIAWHLAPAPRGIGVVATF